MIFCSLISDETRRKLKLVIKDKELAIPVKDVKITITLDDKTKIEDKHSNGYGEYIHEAFFHVGSKLEVKLNKENFEDVTMEIKVGDGVEGVFEGVMEFKKTR